MDNFIKNLNKSILLRNLFGGAFTIFSFQLASEINPVQYLIENITAYLISSILIGAYIYVLHRCILYPIFEYAITLIFSSNKTRHIFISKKTTDYLISIWKLDNNEDTDNLTGLFEKTKEWGDNTHSSYTSGWGILLGLLAHIIYFIKQSEPFPDIQNIYISLLLCVACILILSGFISDIRLRSVREAILRTTVKNKEQNKDIE